MHSSSALNSAYRTHVSVIVVACNSGPLLTECVRAALASTVALKVIVSDNDSDDCSLAGVERIAESDSRLTVVRNRRNLGFAAGNNSVLDLVAGPYVLFLNPDCVIAPETLERMLAVLDASPGAGMAGCVIRNPDGSEQAGCRRHLPTPRRLLAKAFGLDRLLPREICFGDFVRSSEPLPTGVMEVEAISGAFMLVRAEALRDVGSFDPAYFMHWEDLDLCARFRAAGHAILFVPDVEALHFKGRSSVRRPLRVEWHKHAGMVRYLRKFHYARWPWLLFALLTMPVWLRFLARAISMGYEPQHAAMQAADSIDSAEEVWVFGATSPVGCYLLPRLLADGYRVRAFSRDPARHGAGAGPSLCWESADIDRGPVSSRGGRPLVVIHLAPLYLLPSHIDRLLAGGMERLIAFGSTSVFTKRNGSEKERELVDRLVSAERDIQMKCTSARIRWAIFRPTIVYGTAGRGGIAMLSAFVRLFGFIPVFGMGRGLRQPVHADDLAKACLSLLNSEAGWSQAYDLGGGETLSYREMLGRIFRKLNRTTRIFRISERGFRFILFLTRWLPVYRGLDIEMVRHMERDMCFDNHRAHEAFGYHPRSFEP